MHVYINSCACSPYSSRTNLPEDVASVQTWAEFVSRAALALYCCCFANGNCRFIVFLFPFFLLRQTWNFNFTHTQFNLKIFGKENIGKCCEHRLEWFNSISSMFSRRKKNKTTRFQFVRELCLCCKLALEVEQVDTLTLVQPTNCFHRINCTCQVWWPRMNAPSWLGPVSIWNCIIDHWATKPTNQ